jgi:hypothetical protein
MMNRLAVPAVFLALLPALGIAPARAQAQGSCFPTATHLCLNGDRFQVDVDWLLPSGPGKGQAVPLTADTGLFWFFGNSNLELIVKVLDGRPVNGHFWVYYGGLSDVEYRITITDTQTGTREIYTNPPGRLASGSDTSAFDAEPAAAAHKAAPSPLPAPAPLRLGPEFQVNVTTLGSQRSPAVAVGPDGGFAIAWLGPPGGVQGRFYDANGRPRGCEVFPTAAAVSAVAPAIAADTAGRFMIVWHGEGRVKGRIYGSDGQPATGELAIGLNPLQPGAPEIVADPAGGFLVGWPEYGDGTLRLQRFSSQGNLAGNEIRITRPGYGLRLAAFPAGNGFVMAWTEVAGVLETNVRALRLDASGRPASLSSLQVNLGSERLPGYNQSPVPVVHPDGGFSVIWTTYSSEPGPGVRRGLLARRFGAGPDGGTAGDILQLSAGEKVEAWKANALTLPSGEVMVLWYEQGRREDLDGGTFGRLYDAAWNPLGGPFRINTYTQNLQAQPAVAADASGNLVTAWESAVETSPIPELPDDFFGIGQDGSYAGVFAQRFTTASCTADPSRQLCLNGRFRVEVQFTDPRSNLPGAGQAVPLTSDTGGFWFFDASNTELMIKILDGRALNGHFWVFAGALSDVEYTITVTDTQTGKTKAYHNAPHQLASRADTTAF